nr:ABC transporter substrate-binding protein [Lachnospiraceae bacterium]
MNKTGKKVLIFVGVIAVFVVVCVLLSLRPVETFYEKYSGADLNREVAGMERTGTYQGYLREHSDAAYADNTVDVDITGVTGNEGVELKQAFEGADAAVLTQLDSEATWTVDVPKAGLYNIYLEYMITESHGVAAERSVRINGEYPFTDAQNISLTRIWTDGGQKRVDNQGNEIRPTQVEVFDWQSCRLADDRGYESDPYLFYFEAGSNTIT